MRIRRASWEEDGEAIRAIRTEVFVREQGVPVERELDGLDAGCAHVLAEDGDGQAIGTARLLPDGHIGRMAVRAALRGRGIGSAMLQELVAAARARGLHPAVNAQVSAADFYRRHGFVSVGDVFVDAGIDHVHMTITDR